MGTAAAIKFDKTEKNFASPPPPLFLQFVQVQAPFIDWLLFCYMKGLTKLRQ